MRNPYPKILIDDTSGTEVPDERHQLWQEGHDARRDEIRNSHPWDYPNQPFEIRLPSGAIKIFSGCEGAIVVDTRTGKEYPYTSLY